jgi:hypothetical protein
MRQRGFGLITFLPYIIGGLAIASLAGWVWWQANSWCNRVCRDATEQADAYRAELDIAKAQAEDARKRATALALLWSDAIHRIEVRYVEIVKWRTQTFVEIRERPYHAEGSITLGPDARGVLRDSADAANNPGPTASGEGAAAPVPETAGSVTTAQEWIAFATDAAEAYADARGKWLACVNWAESVHRTAPSQDGPTRTDSAR